MKSTTKNKTLKKIIKFVKEQAVIIIVIVVFAIILIISNMIPSGNRYAKKLAETYNLNYADYSYVVEEMDNNKTFGKQKRLVKIYTGTWYIEAIMTKENGKIIVEKIINVKG